MRIPRRRVKALSHLETVRISALRLIPQDGSVTALIRVVGAKRGRPIELIALPLPSDSPSGAWISSPAVDYIVIDSTSTPTRRDAIICHELAHMLLGHQGEPFSADQLTMLAPTIKPQVAARVLGRHGYATEAEHDAEVLATVLVAAADRARCGGPDQDRVSRRVC